MKQTTKFKEKIYELTREIPKGKVTTYKELANTLNTKAYRAVGTAMATNPDIPKTPCHRVVKSDGRVGEYANKPEKKIQMLKSEGVEVINGKINLKKYLHTFL